VLVLGDFYVSSRASKGAEYDVARSVSQPAREPLPEVALTARVAPN
jgi:hypothetical protein